MSLKEIDRGASSLGVKRIYYKDEEGRLVERVLHDSDDHNPVIAHNEAVRDAQRGQFAPKMRKVASIPNDILLKWLMEEGVDGFCDGEAIDMVIRKKLSDPDNAKFRTVGNNYNIKNVE